MSTDSTDRAKLQIYDSIPIPDLEAYLRKANEEYRKGTPFISDELYDTLYDNLKSRDPENKFIKSLEFLSESISIEREKKTLPYPLFSLDKIKNDEKQLENWKDKFDIDTHGVVVSEKLDGNSALLIIRSETKSSKKNTKINYELYTRGNGFVGQVITHLVPYLRNIPSDSKSFPKNEVPSSFAIRGELILSKTDWVKVKTINPDLTNPRNAVAGIVNAKEPNVEIAKYIQFVGYEVIEPINLKPSQQFQLLQSQNLSGAKPAHYKIINDPTIESLSDYLNERRAKSEFEVDGIVVSSNAVYPRPTEDNPKYSFAFKSVLTQERAEVTVTNVTWAVSKDGVMNPLVHFPTVNLNGVNISKATGKSGKFIVENVIGPGSVIVIIRAGDVIPDIIEVLKPSSNKQPSLPTVEDLGGDLGNSKDAYEGIIFWNKNNVDLEVDIDVLKEKYGLKSRLYCEILIKQYTHFFNTIDVDGVSEGLIVRLFNAGKTSLKDLLSLTTEDILASDVEGVKERSATKIVNAIHNALEKIKSDGINGFITLMTASGCFGAGFGNRRLKALLKAIPDLVKKDYIPKIEEIVAIEGFAEITASQFLEGLPKFWKFVTENGFTDFINSLKTSRASLKESSVFNLNQNQELKYRPLFSGKTYVFSGFRNSEYEYLDQRSGETRSIDLVSLIEHYGGKVGSAVTKKTSMLVIKDKTPESLKGKYEKALELNIPVITLKEFRESIGPSFVI
jgi:NAD-dependent DNA ligase